jgi:hypothetical protein
MKRIKKILIAAAVAVCLAALWYAAFFTTAEIPGFLMKPAGSNETPSHKRYVALVLKWRGFEMESLNEGDLIVIQRRLGDKVCSEVRRLEKIQQPDESERQKVHIDVGGKYEGSQRIAQAILNMDFKPKYWISGDGTNSTSPVRIEEADIKGKVVHIFAKD